MKLSLFSTLRGYRKEYLPKDIFSGIIIAAVSIPISMGYAQISGIPAVYGLYGSVLPILLFALFSTSRQFIFGVDAAPAAIVGGALSTLGIAAESEAAMDYVPAIALFAGLWLFIFFLLHADKIVDFISTPVMGGFISGIAVTIILMQIPKLMGSPAGSGELLELAEHIFAAAKNISWLSLFMGLGALVLIRTFKKLAPKFPMAIVIMALGVLSTVVFHVNEKGVVLLQSVERGLPSLVIPDFGIVDLTQAAGRAGRGSRPGRIRDTFQHLQAGLFGGGIVAQHDAGNAAAYRVRFGEHHGGGLLHDDAAALEPRRAHPCLTGAHLHAQAALCRDGEILLGAVHAAQAGGEVARSVVGIVGNAVFGVSNVLLCLVPGGRAQPDGAGGAAVLALGDDVGHAHHGSVAQLGQAGAQHVAHLQGVVVHVKLDTSGAQLGQKLFAAPVSQLCQIALAGAGLVFVLVRLDVPGIDVHFPPVGASGVYIAHPNGGALVTFASALHKGHVGVIGIGKAPPGIQQIAPLGAVSAVRVEGGPETLEE